MKGYLLVPVVEGSVECGVQGMFQSLIASYEEQVYTRKLRRVVYNSIIIVLNVMLVYNDPVHTSSKPKGNEYSALIIL